MEYISKFNSFNEGSLNLPLKRLYNSSELDRILDDEYISQYINLPSIMKKLNESRSTDHTIVGRYINTFEYLIPNIHKRVNKLVTKYTPEYKLAIGVLLCSNTENIIGTFTKDYHQPTFPYKFKLLDPNYPTEHDVYNGHLRMVIYTKDINVSEENLFELNVKLSSMGFYFEEKYSGSIHLKFESNIILDMTKNAIKKINR